MICSILVSPCIILCRISVMWEVVTEQCRRYQPYFLWVGILTSQTWTRITTFGGLLGKETSVRKTVYSFWFECENTDELLCHHNSCPRQAGTP